MSYAADDHEAIRRRLEELAAERNLALTGRSLPIEEIKTETHGWAMYGHDYDAA